jgi:hypothetical protein
VVINYTFEVVTCGVTFVPNFMNFRPSIPKLINTYSCECVRFGKVSSGYVRLLMRMRIRS